MSRTAILIGFYYKGCEEIYHMPAILLDLYRVYRHVKRIGITDIIFICDTTEIESYNQHILRLIIEGTIGEDFLHFNEIMSKQHTLIIPKTVEDVFSVVHSINSNVRKIFLYYGGHAISGDAIISIPDILLYEDLPRIMINVLITRLLKKLDTRTHAQAFIILDCCNSNGLNLAFSMEHNQISHNYDCGKYNADIVCLSPTNMDEYAIMKQEGSDFTISLFDNLKNSLTIRELWISLVDDDSTINIRSTHPRYLNKNVPIWAWVRYNTHLSIYYDPIEHSIIIIN